LRLHRRPGPEVWCHARLTSGAGKSGGVFTGDLVLLDEAGQALAEVSGLRMAQPRSAASPASSAPERAETTNGWLHEIRWQLAAAEASPGDRRQPGSWLLLMDRGGTAEKVARRIEALGETVIRVAPGTGIGGGLAATADGSWALDPSAPEAFAALLRQASGERGCRGVVHFWSLGFPPPDETAQAAPESAADLCGSALCLIQALTRTGWRDMPRLWLITRGAQPAGAAPARLAVAQAPLWGLGRTLLYEHPELRATRIDLSPVAMDAETEMLAGELLSASPEEELALRPEGRYVARLVRRPARVPVAVPLAEASPIRGDATYLITGGLGGLGLTAAKWLVGKGARHLLLVGRQGPGDAARQALAVLAAAGAKVEVAQADVADRGQLAGVLARLDGSQPPLRGVIHAAGILDDGLLQDLDLERFRKVMAPKAAGAWNLHVLTRGAPLDFFVLYSSAVSLLGSPGQANYAAGNAFLDALAHLRRAQGLPALSVNWGPFSEVGLAAERADRGERLADRGLGSLTPWQGVEVLGRLLGTQDVQVAVMPLDLGRWIEFHPTAATAPRLAAGLAEPGSGANDRPQAVGQGEPDILAARRQAAPGQRRALVEGFVREQVAKTLRLPASRIDPAVPLARQGLDSLMSLELRNRLQRDLRLRLSTTLLWTYADVVSLGQFLEQQLELAGGDTPDGAPGAGRTADVRAPAADEPGDESASELDLLSIDELAARLMEKVI
jgi:NAD(P)-dependent dehydrogenase (short-subunit alcohol dehydrogenase family)/acyl carrier protein